jgi:hypothetical protein
VTASAILILAAIILSKNLHERREAKKKEVFDLALSIIEEGIAFSEEKNKFNKVEAAHNAGLALKKQPVEVTKDPIASTRFFQTAMIPQRQICHNNAKEYILSSIKSMKNEEMKKSLSALLDGVLDDAIKMRIMAAKMGNLDPVKPLLYRNML